MHLVWPQLGRCALGPIKLSYHTPHIHPRSRYTLGRKRIHKHAVVNNKDHLYFKNVKYKPYILSPANDHYNQCSASLHFDFSQNTGERHKWTQSYLWIKTQDLGTHVKLHCTKAVFTTDHPASLWKDSLSEGDLLFILWWLEARLHSDHSHSSTARGPQGASLWCQPVAWTLSVLAHGGAAGNHGVLGLPVADTYAESLVQQCVTGSLVLQNVLGQRNR